MSEKYHEIIQPAKEIVMGWGARILDLIVPEEASDLPNRGAAPMLDRELSSPRSVPPANPGDWDSLKGV